MMIEDDIFNGTQPQCHYTKEGMNDTFACDNGWIYDIHHGTEASVVTEVIQSLYKFCLLMSKIHISWVALSLVLKINERQKI